jgi:hypothetical protein
VIFLKLFCLGEAYYNKGGLLIKYLFMNTLKQSFIITIIVAVIFSLLSITPAVINAHVANAQDIDNATSTRADRKEDAREKKEEAREERRERLDEARKARILRFVDRIIRRMDAATGRLSNISERIGNRIDKFEGRGGNMDTAKELLGIANAEINVAEETIGSLSDAMREVVESEDPKAAFAEVRLMFGEAKDAIKAAHAALVDVIVEIKGIGNSLGDEDDDSTEGDSDDD